MGDIDKATTEELEAALQARRELGRDFERELAESFVDRIEHTVAARIDARFAEHGGDVKQLRRSEEGARIRQFVLGLVSLGTGVPITLFAAGVASGGDQGPSVGGILVAWTGIVGVNAAHAWSNRPTRLRSS